MLLCYDYVMFKTTTFNEKILKQEKTDLGLTNQNYIVTLDDKQQFFVRIPYDHNHDLFNYELEKHIHETIKDANINLPYVSIDSETGIKVSPYLKNIKHFDELDLVQSLPKIAEKIRQLHQHPKTNVDFRTKEKYHIFKQKTKNSLINLDDYEFVLDELDQFSERVLCHNDLVNGNVIEYNNEIYLIDYEYACDNHPYFDLLSLLTENSIYNKHVRKIFFEAYFNHPITQSLQHDLDVFESVHDLLWCQWAQMQFSILKEPIYKQIADQKYDQLKKMIQKL